MAIEVWREMFCYKISSELTEIKLQILRQSKEEIWACAYQIDSIINIYEIMLEMSQKLSVGQLKYGIQTPQLLMLLYSEWLKIEDSAYEEMKDYLCSLFQADRKEVA